MLRLWAVLEVLYSSGKRNSELTGLNLSSIDRAISSAELPLDQLERSGKQVSGSIRALDVIVLMANHFEEHLAQLKDEVRPREGLPNI